MMKLCEQCHRDPVVFPGSKKGGGSRFCRTCLDEKVSLIMDVRAVIRHYGVQEG